MVPIGEVERGCVAWRGVVSGGGREGGREGRWRWVGVWGGVGWGGGMGDKLL